ncbi:hypothetical protein D3C78_1803040 [compost metagenome]
MYINGEVVVYLGNPNATYQNKICVYRSGQWRTQETVAGAIHGAAGGVQVGNDLILVGDFNGTTRHGLVSKLRKVP